MQHETQYPIEDDLANTFVLAGSRMFKQALTAMHQRDPHFADAIVQAFMHGERARVSLTLELDGSFAPLIELSTVDDYGGVKPIGHVATQPRAFH